MIAATSFQPPKHDLHWWFKIALSGHGIPIIALTLAVVLIVVFAFFKLSQTRST